MERGGMDNYGVTLLSGGLDSTTVTAYAQSRTKHLTALTFYYGQIHSKEVECARDIAALMGIAHELLDISFFGKVAWYSALTQPDQFPMPKEDITERISVNIPISYVPLRNTVFLALAAAFLESQVLHAIEVEGVDPKNIEGKLYMGPNAIDYSGYPDCRPEYFKRMGEALEYGSKIWTQYRVPIQLETPIIQMAKADIVRLGMELKAPLNRTWSCYQGGQKPCGKCDSCILRAKGFKDAGVPDPSPAPLVEE
jgi:7-cyano-7-deazaguanine synthase